MSVGLLQIEVSCSVKQKLQLMIMFVDRHALIKRGTRAGLLQTKRKNLCMKGTN